MLNSPERSIDANPNSGELPTLPASVQASYPDGLMDFGSSVTYGRPIFGEDYWDPSILATSNWLDLVGEVDEFPQAQFSLSYNGSDAFDTGVEAPAWNVGAPDPIFSGNVPRSDSTTMTSPSAMTSTTSSARSGGSARKALDLIVAQHQSKDKRGDFYVDGNPARQPRTMMNRPGLRRNIPDAPTTSTFSLQTPQVDDYNLSHCLEIPARTYETLHVEWERLCVADSALWSVFDPTEFPPLPVFEHCLALYFSHFHQTLPFLHAGTFDSTTADWTLILAMIAIGARFLETTDCETFVISLQEFLRRCQLRSREASGQAFDGRIETAQAYILHLIGQLYSGDERLTQFGIEHTRPLVATAVRSLQNQSSTSNSQNGDTAWHAWLRRESYSRAWYSAFLLDSMVTYQFEQRPSILVDECKPPLPCADEIWNGPVVEHRRTEACLPTSAPTLPVALQEIYIDKRVSSDRGEFARIIMMHGLFHRSLEVETYFGNPLSHWEPTAKKQSNASILPSHPIWPPSVTTFVKWQNSVCDCLDILHWQANATIGQARGLEHPTVAFLHLSRVVLLTPLRQIVRHAKATTVGDSESIEYAQDKRFIQLWAAQGQYKARLAAIHAGVVFWHIRRYSVDGFYEASTVALATLVLWAFSTFSKNQSDDRDPAHLASRLQDTVPAAEKPQVGRHEATRCNIILLDHPTDDELVQQFIRRGHDMKAYMDGVGDLYEPDGSQRVLAEGCKLLRTLRCWRAARHWLEMLRNLADVCKNKGN